MFQIRLNKNNGQNSATSFGRATIGHPLANEKQPINSPF